MKQRLTADQADRLWRETSAHVRSQLLWTIREMREWRYGDGEWPMHLRSVGQSALELGLLTGEIHDDGRRRSDHPGAQLELW